MSRKPSHSRVGKPLLRALDGETLSTPPIWLMRQAGRYLPEYRATRKQAGDFLTLCYTPELAAKVSLQPVERFDLDAAILFADILLVPNALGQHLEIVNGLGPRLPPIHGMSGVQALRNVEDIHETLDPVYSTIQMLAKELPKDVALIGFAGAPWTVATYMIAGRGVPGRLPAKSFLANQPAATEALFDILVNSTIGYLKEQAKAGAEVLMLFDSWAGELPDHWFQRYVIDPTRRIIDGVKEQFPSLPVIVFPRKAGLRYEGFAEATRADCVSVDQEIDAQWVAEHLQNSHCVQGNLDPRHLVDGGQPMITETMSIISALSKGPHIFNLGHGITPDADPANVEFLVRTVKEYQASPEHS